MMTDISDNDIQATEAAWTITKVANAEHAAQDKQSECMMEMFKQMMATMMNATGNKNNTQNSNPQEGFSRQHKQYKHCKLNYAKPESKCWKLEVNSTSCPANWKPVAECKKNT